MSAEGELPAALAQFIMRHLDSVAELEALLLVHSTPTRGWTVADLATRLYITDAEAGTVLHTLHRRCLVAREGDACRYAPAAEDLRRDVEALAAAYPRFLIPITTALHAKPRSAPPDFADACRVREEK